MNALFVAVLLAAAPRPASPCAKPKIGFDGGLQLPADATKFDGPRLSEAASRCLVELGKGLAAKEDLVGLTIAAAHDKDERADGYERARAVKLALEAGGLPSGRISAVGLATGAKLEIFLRTGKSSIPAQVALAEGSAALLAPGTPLDVGAPIRVPPGGRVVVVFANGGAVELAGGSEAKIGGPGTVELVAGSAVLRGEGTAVVTRLGTVRGGGLAEVILRDGGAVVVAEAGAAQVGGAAIAEGEGGFVKGKALQAEARLPAPARAAADAGGAIPASLGFAEVAGAHHYEVALAPDTGFVAGVRKLGVAPGKPAALPTRDASWLRVRAVSDAGVPGRWSVLRPVTPAPPADGS